MTDSKNEQQAVDALFVPLRDLWPLTVLACCRILRPDDLVIVWAIFPPRMEAVLAQTLTLPPSGARPPPSFPQ